MLIDPQLQGIHWLKSMFKDSGLDVVRVGSKDIMRKVKENPIAIGIGTMAPPPCAAACSSS